MTVTMAQFVEIVFDCLPLRSVGRLDVPIDASPKYRARCERIKHAIETHGSHNTFYLYNASCTFHLTNEPQLGMMQFAFEGTVLTDALDQKTVAAHLNVMLERETCDWLIEPVVAWFTDTVSHAVKAEFDRYIAAGDLKAAILRIEKLQAESDSAGGYMGMYL
jgi:hypothetical protein